MTDSLKDIPILYEKAKNSGYLDGVYCATADCSDFPSLEITFEGDNGNFTLELESKYFLRPGNGKNHYYIGIFSSFGTRNNGKSVQFILGQEFIHKYYTVYDYTNMRVGFVEQYRAPAPPTALINQIRAPVSATGALLSRAAYTSV